MLTKHRHLAAADYLVNGAPLGGATAHTTMRHGLLDQAARARGLGAEFTARVLETCFDYLDVAPVLARAIDGWPGDFKADAVALRLAAGLHALARRRALPGLAALYAQLDGDFRGAISEALDACEAFLLKWLSGPTQTNETARAAAFVGGIMAASQDSNMPIELLEIGTSAGLNLNMARYAYALGGTAAGDPHSPLKIAPEWHGPPPPQIPFTVIRAQGVDLNPLDVADPVNRERMAAYVWADQAARMQRLALATGLALQHPPAIETGSAVPWLCDRLAQPQARNTRRVVLNSMVLQYLTPTDRHLLRETLDRAGADATPDRPLLWLSLEWDSQRSKVSLRMTHWQTGSPPDVADVEIATCTPYCDRITWLDSTPRA